MKKINEKGFTLIELLAVIVIMGILMMVAIPAVSRTIENSRKDTFLDVAKQYANAAKTLWAADGLKCYAGRDATTGNEIWTVSSAVDAGTASSPKYYYVKIDSSNSNPDVVLLYQGGKSAWGNKNVLVYVKVGVVSTNNRVITTYNVALTDKTHGVADGLADDLGRSYVKTDAAATSTIETFVNGLGTTGTTTTVCKEV